MRPVLLLFSSLGDLESGLFRAKGAYRQRSKPSRCNDVTNEMRTTRSVCYKKLFNRCKLCSVRNLGCSAYTRIITTLTGHATNFVI